MTQLISWYETHFNVCVPHIPDLTTLPIAFLCCPYYLARNAGKNSLYAPRNWNHLKTCVWFCVCGCDDVDVNELVDDVVGGETVSFSRVMRTWHRYNMQIHQSSMDVWILFQFVCSTSLKPYRTFSISSGSGMQVLRETTKLRELRAKVFCAVRCHSRARATPRKRGVRQRVRRKCFWAQQQPQSQQRKMCLCIFRKPVSCWNPYTEISVVG